MASILSPILLGLWDEYSRSSFATFSAEWTSLAFGLGQALTIDTGAERVTGIFSGVSDRGGLLLEKGSELSEIISGHVVVS